MNVQPAFEVIVCGSLHLDIVVRAKALPQIDETAVGSSWAQVCGGKGGNQAVQAARAGARAAMIGRVGDDDFGHRLRRNLEDSGVEVSGLATDPVNGSGMSVAILQDNGDYGAVIVSGSNLAIDPETVQGQWDSLGGAKVLVLQNEVPHAVNVAAARVARTAGAQVVFNAAPARTNADDLLALVDILIVNRVEAGAMSEMPVADRSSARAAMTALCKGARSVVVTLGGDGMVVATDERQIHDIEAIPVRVTSTHGAGDCFVGTLAAALAGGASLLAACKTANESAAAFVSRQM